MRAIFTYFISIAVGYTSYVVYNSYASAYSSIVKKPGKRYDYIIVGAGTSGCVLASRLSEDPNTSVLLIEAGDHMGFFTKIPLTAPAAQQGPNDWSVKTTPQKYSSFGMWSQSQFLPRGKGLGGSGQINFLLHGFGLPSDFETWTSLGAKSWSYEDLKPYFVKAFGTVQNEFDSEDCSIDGECPGGKAPMKLKVPSNNELSTTFKQASDLLTDPHTYFRKPAATIKDGRRFASLEGYLMPALDRENLHVLMKTQAISIRFENKTASSLYILQNHRELNNIFVNKEIILSAGAIKTPQILIRSGIGPENTLKRLKVRPILTNPAVGRNLHDHMNMPIYISIKKPISVTLAKVFTFNTVWEYFWKGTGLLSYPPVAGIEYHNGSALILFSMGTASERLLRDLSNYKHKVFRDIYPFYNITNKEGFMFLSTCLQPQTRGTVTLSDFSSAADPVVDPQYLYRHSDVTCHIQALRRAERLISTKPFREIGAKIHWPRPERCLTFWNYTKQEQKGGRRKKFYLYDVDCIWHEHIVSGTLTLPQHQWRLVGYRTGGALDLLTKHKNESRPKSPPDEYLSCIIREVAVTGHHVGGTCSIGTVVDQQLRIKSLQGVRIMDASVLPSPVSLFPNSVLIGMAEKAADIIRYNK